MQGCFALIKNAIRSGLTKFGYTIVPKNNDQLYVTTNDKAARQELLDLILPSLVEDCRTEHAPTVDDISSYFTEKRLAMTRILIEECERAGIVFAESSLLDVGCHGGCLLRTVHNRWPNAALYGCDITNVKLNMARKSCPSAKIFYSSIQNIDHHTKYDIIFLTQVLEHLVEPEQALLQLRSACNTHGALILTVPDGRIDQFPAKKYNAQFRSYGGHINFWSPESWHIFLEKLFHEESVVTTALPTGNLMAIIR